MLGGILGFDVNDVFYDLVLSMTYDDISSNHDSLIVTIV